MIQLTYVFVYGFCIIGPEISEYIKQLILLYVIQLSGVHSKF